MKILIAGACGFVGSTLARTFAEHGDGLELHGFDTFIRPGSESNRDELKRLGVRLRHADVRSPSDVEALLACDWIIDAAANPSVLGGLDGQASARQVVEHNLAGTVNLLEHAKRCRAGFILLSTSRVYSISRMAALPLAEGTDAFRLEAAGEACGPEGIRENFSTEAPRSLYGATKLASEVLALEYGEAFGLPVFVNRCGLMAGAGQFGRPDQGIYAFWINSWLRKRPLTYLGFGGTGRQVRDCLHPRDLAPLLRAQFGAPRLEADQRIVNVSGGSASARSLRQLSAWCAERFGEHPVAGNPALRPFDLPWIVLDSAKARKLWDWQPTCAIAEIWEEIAVHAERHPDWMELSAAF
jgi:CDP-paratose 2-epimerase